MIRRIPILGGRALVVLTSLVVMTAGLGAAPASAQPQQLRAPAEFIPPNSLAVTGARFPAGETVEFRFGAGPTLTTGVVATNGAVIGILPTSSLAPGPVTINACALCGTPDEVAASTTSRALGVPQPVIAPITDPAIGEPVTLDGSSSSDPDGSVLSWSWRIIGPAGAAAVRSGATASFTPALAGAHTVRLTIEDDDGIIGIAERSFIAGSVVPVNQNPVAVADVPLSGQAGQAVIMSSGGSTDADGTITAVLWNFGDGTTSSAPIPSHAWNTAGIYNVVLVVTDDDGATATDTAAITIAPPPTTVTPNAPPNAEAGARRFTQAGDRLRFDGRGSSDDDGSIVSYIWAFGDGQTGSGSTPSHVYVTPGRYRVVLTVRDDDGAISSDTATVTVSPRPPSPTSPPRTSPPPGPTATNPPPAPTTTSLDNPPSTGPSLTDEAPSTRLPGSEVAQLDLGGAREITVEEPLVLRGPRTLGGDEVTTWSWSLGDGNTTTEPDTDHLYGVAGRFTAKLEVETAGGALGFGTVVVTVNPIDVGDGTPIADIGGPYTPVAGEPFTLDASDSVDSDGTIVSWEWNAGGTLLSGERVDHVFAEPGQRLVVLRVTDDEGKFSQIATFADVFPPDCLLEPDLVEDFRARPRQATTPGALTTIRLVVGVDCAGLQVAFAVDGQTVAERVPIGPAGLAEVALRLPDDLQPGEHTISVMRVDDGVAIANTSWTLLGSNSVECSLAADDIRSASAETAGRDIRVTLSLADPRACTGQALAVTISGGSGPPTVGDLVIDGRRSSATLSRPGGFEPGDYAVSITSANGTVADLSVGVGSAEAGGIQFWIIITAAALTAAVLATGATALFRRP